MGETADFDNWVRSRGQALLRFAYLVTRDQVRAEEAVQSALVSACARWARIVRADDPETYVRRMVVNADRTLWRRFRRREVPVAEVLPPVDSRVADIADAVVAEDAVWALVATLPSRQRAAVVLRFYEGRSDNEIAAILECGEGTVRSQISRALASLRARLGEQDDEARNEVERA
jgi:RNA polymerase sigma-70 factor (sigma-E family)